MRDERWVNRFLFSWNDTLFFDPLEIYYEPRPDHFVAAFDDDVRSRFERRGIWWSHRHNESLSAQGWKIHVSAGLRDVHRVAEAVIRYLTGHGIDFKIALDINIYEMLNSKASSRTSGGKFITIYPDDEDQFRTCLADLAGILEGAEGAYVLSDQRYKDCKALYFRYGQFLNTHTIDAMGRQVPHIAGPDGPIVDDRRLGFVAPWWLPWPIHDWKPNADTDDDELLGGRFRVTAAIQFSNTGGVYEAEDTAYADRRVVVKEARPHTNVNPRHRYDALDVLDREWHFLNRLAGVGWFAAPIARFDHWEHRFIAEEFIEGTDIRSVLLERNPLARPVITVEGSRAFLRIFVAVFRGMATAVQAAHDRKVILGDLSAANLLIDPDTYKVTIVDLESCRLAESEGQEAYLEEPVELFTPGFSHSRRISEASVPEDDLYGLATTMAYFIFPIAAMLYLRDDVLSRYRVFTDGLGWPTRIHQLIVDLAGARISLADVLQELEKEAEWTEQVRLPPAVPVVEERLGFAETEASIALFVEQAADPERESLFPVDPFAHITNPLSLGFGASGVLWSLAASGIRLQPEWLDWLRDRVSGLDFAAYPSGLMNGLAGIAWAIDTLGLHEPARRLLAYANEQPGDDYTFYYGLAGLGMTNLRFYLRGHADEDLVAARACARKLVDAVEHNGRTAYWTNEFATERPLTGLGFGQAGVAMFLLRMYQATGDESYLRLGRDALTWEMLHAVPVEGGGLMFEHERTLEPYVEVGSAGVAQVLLRYGDQKTARTVLRGISIGYSVLPGYAFGISGIADAMLDAAAYLDDPSYREIALRQLQFVREVYLFEPAERFGMRRSEGIPPLALPGEGLLRCACDYMTGSAGVLRVLHRLNHGGTTDFLLDEGWR